MKILYITNGYPPHRWAGTETYTAGIAEGFAKKGHKVQVLCAGTWDHGDSYWNGVSEDEYNGIPVRRINFNWAKAPDPFHYLYDNPVVADYLTALLNEIEPDVVHVTSCETLSAGVLRVVKDAGIPLVLSLTDFWFLCPRIDLLHGDGYNCDGRTSPAVCLDCKMLTGRLYNQTRKVVPELILFPMLETISRYPSITRMRGFRGLVGDMAGRKSLLKHALTLPDHIVTASNFVREIFLLNGVESEIVVQPYGHDLSWLESYSGKSHSKVVRFGYVGQIIPSKGVHLLLQAMSFLPRNVLDKISLKIYGNLEHTPDYGRQLRGLATQFPNVSFRGTYSHADSAKVFSDIDVLLVPSLWYDFPLVIYEAFATRTPVIATDLGGMAEAIEHEKNGLLFERGNLDALASQISRIVEEPAFLETLHQGISRVKTVHEEVVALLQIYEKLLAFAITGIGLKMQPDPSIR